MSGNGFKSRVWPQSAHGDTLVTTRMRLLIVLSFAAGSLGVLTALISFGATWDGYPVQTLVGLIGPMLFLVVPFALHLTGWLVTISRLVIAALFGLILLPAFTMGASLNAVVLYLAAAPLLATFLLGFRSGLVLGGVAIAFTIGLYLARPYLPPLPEGYNADLAAYWTTITLSILIVGTSVFAAVFQHQMEDAARKLEVARREADSGNQAKSDFLANMSHEIRTPLNGVLGMARLLRQKGLDPENDRKVEVIERSGEMLLSLLNEILDLSKVEAGCMELERIPFDLRSTIETIDALYRPAANDKGLHLHIDIDDAVAPEYFGDPIRMSQILNNLVSNAVKFTSEGGVNVACAAAEGRGVILTVSDTGIGMAPSVRDALFERFTQADASITRTHGGTGLGLTICKQLTDLMGGTILVESTPGVGSRFMIELPLQTARQTAAA
ncbi:MAG: hypothetical protein CMF74_10620 [Maricaulis sp.]|nr:hypothetical protein [Maricaulis sp.]